MRPFVELEGVGVSYGEVRVLDGINLTVEPGDFLGIIGPNGSGKTTLLRVILGLLEPQEGSVRLFGQAPAAAQEEPRRNPPSTSDGQWACSTRRARPTRTIMMATTAVSPSRWTRLHGSLMAK